MQKGNKRRFSIKGQPLYPHIKITRERFPRILATRLIADDDAEYFGAFLNRTNARILIDFLNRTFQLRSCEIDIDGSFDYPCTMHYKRRCLAPCVADLIGEGEYGEMVALVRLFLLNDRSLFRSVVATKMVKAAENLDFEAASRWRDILNAVEEYWADTRHAVWLDASDTFSFRATETGLDIFLTSQKGRRVLGERVFSFPSAGELDAPEAIGDVIEQFYRFHAPKEIRVAVELPRKAELEKALSAKFRRRVRIVILNETIRKVSTELALHRSSAELDVKRLIITLTPRQVVAEIKRSFALTKAVSRICAIDVSHISGTNQVAAAIVWEGGRSVEAEYWLSDSLGEIESLAQFVRRKYSKSDSQPELILIDGGISQLNAAIGANLSESGTVVAAVKPPTDHSAISHFLTAGGQRIEFDITVESHRLLQRLRDEAHDFANAVHRDVRDFAGFYEAANILPSMTETERRRLVRSVGSSAKGASASESQLVEAIGAKRAPIAASDIENYKAGRNTGVTPLVVPVRFQDQNGAADDLRPIDATSRKHRKRLR